MHSNIFTFAKNNIMRKYVAIVLIAFTILACNTGSNGFVLNGEITGGLADSTKVFLKTTDSTNLLIDVDTTIVIGGKFKFTGNQETPILHYMLVEGSRANLPVVIENGTIKFKAQKDSLQFASAKGTPQNELFNTFLVEQRKMQQMAQSMQLDMRQAQTAKDTAAMSSLREEFFELQEKSKNYNLDYIKENPSALISAFLLENVLRTNGLSNKEVRALYDSFTEEVKASKPGQNIARELARTAATEIGAVAPQFSGPSPDGNILALNEVKGKLTLIDFWAAWCKPCRAENPNIVSVYNEYKNKGLQVVGVSLDRKSEDWLKAIEADGLAWNHISNLDYFNDPIAKMYGVNAIPAAFLLDENGVIIAKNLRGPALGQKIAELLN